MDKKIGPTSGEPKSNLKDNSSSAQRKRLDEALQNRPGGMTTDQIRYELDIMMPAARVHELRWGEGKNIVTYWQDIETKPGCKHRVARYILLPGKWREVA